MAISHLVLALLLGQAASITPPVEITCSNALPVPGDIDGLVEALRTAPTSLEMHVTNTRPCLFPEEDRVAAIHRRLQQFGPATIPALTRALHDPDVRLRRNVMWFLAINALARARPPAGTSPMDLKWAVPILTEMLSDDDEYVRLRAVDCFALSDIGHDGAPALPALRRALDSVPPDSVPHRLTETAIQKIER